MKMFIRGVALVAGGVLAASAAQASVTIATFADDFASASNPIFTINSTGLTLTGGWSSPGLKLIAPVNSSSYPDTKLVFSGTSLTLVAPGQWTTGGGVIDFKENITNTILLHITFDSGLLNATGFGSSDIFIGHNVVFTGAILGYPVTDENFSFAFANQVPTTSPAGFTTTASFTSSATIPAPGAAALLGLGGLVIARRRR